MHSRFKWNYWGNLITLISLLVGTLVAAPAIATPTKPQTIVVFGDSLSAAYGIAQHEGWVSLLQQRLKQNPNRTISLSKVINASMSGETTSGGLSRFADMLKAQQPHIVIIELGANDGLRGLSPIDMRATIWKQ
jgi:acyl-CoA thioesterase I